MYDYHSVLGALGVVVGLIAYVPYLRDVLLGTTKPHVFTWLGWGIINAIVFAAQISSGAGAGAWVTVFTSIAVFSIAIMAFFWGEKNITVSDWIAFIASLSAIAIWVLTRDALWAVILVTLADTVAVIPTVRKAFYKPHEETALAYAIAVLRSILSIAALESFNIVNWLYPAALILSDGGLTTMLLVRRWQLGRIHPGRC